MKFTDASIRSLKPKSGRYEKWEANGRGFGIRVSPSGTKTFLFMYRVKGLSRRMSIGRYPAITLSEARTEHSKARRKLEKGIDPGRELVEKRRGERDASTIEGLAGEYIEDRREKKKKAWKEEERILKKDIIPRWGKRKAEDIKRKEIKALVKGIKDRGAPVMANRALGVINRMFIFAIDEEILDSNPCAKIKPPGEENEKDRVLSSEEIKKFWTEIDKCQMADGTKVALKLLLVFVQRKGELAQAEWSEFDLNSGWWTIPKGKTKNGLAHRVYLPSTAKDILKRVKVLSGESPYLFPSPRGNGSKPISPRSLSQALLNNLDTLKIEPFTPHDLRRSASSHMTGNGIPRETVQKILNHVDRGVTKIYDRYSYDKEKRDAMNKWDRILKKIISGEVGKVIRMNG